MASGVVRWGRRPSMCVSSDVRKLSPMQQIIGRHSADKCAADSLHPHPADVIGSVPSPFHPAVLSKPRVGRLIGDRFEIPMAAHGAIAPEPAAGRPLHATPLPQCMQYMYRAAVPPSVMTPADGAFHASPLGHLRNPKPTPLPAPTRLPVPVPTNHYASAAKLGFGG